MFNKKQEVQYDKFDSLIGKNTRIEGSIHAQGTLRIDGQVNGDITIEGDLFVGDSAKIMGNISSLNLMIAGRVEGNVSVKEQLRITATGKLYGDASMRSFIVDENAQFEGKCKMTNITSEVSQSAYEE